MNAIRAVEGLIEAGANAAPPIRCKWPAIMLAVSRTARAIGWMNRLIVSIPTSTGISRIGVPWGRKYASDDLVLCQKPEITVPVHNGIAMPRFIDSCVVGVKEFGRRPQRLVEPINERNYLWSSSPFDIMYYYYLF